MEIIKKQYLLQIFKMMQAVENELSNTDLAEFRNLFKELSSKVNSIAGALRDGSKLNCDDLVLDIIEKLAPYLKGSIKNITIYRKSRQIQIVA